jgi:hypothetical protein
VFRLAAHEPERPGVAVEDGRTRASLVAHERCDDLRGEDERMKT